MMKKSVALACVVAVVIISAAVSVWTQTQVDRFPGKVVILSTDADALSLLGSLQTLGTTGISISGSGGIVWNAGTPFASLGTPGNGTIKYCANCTIANPCNSGGTGALAKRLNGAWVCN